MQGLFMQIAWIIIYMAKSRKEVEKMKLWTSRFRYSWQKTDAPTEKMERDRQCLKIYSKIFCKIIFRGFKGFLLVLLYLCLL